MNIRLCRKNILTILMLFAAGFIFAEITEISASSVDQFSKDNYKLSSNLITAYPVRIPSTVLAFSGHAGRSADSNIIGSLSGNLAGAENPEKSFRTAAGTVPESNREIEFWLGQTNNPASAVWTVDENNSTRIQHAIVNTADYSQLVIATESKYPSDSEKKKGSAIDSNDCLVESSIAPAGSGSGPPKGQPAPSIVYTLIAGLLTVAGIGWRNIFQTS
ncbi:MAG: hypothetical protein ACYC4Q_03585 [Victivallaceae bacterium]